MALWLPVRLEALLGREAGRAVVEAVALANSGYRASKPQVSVTLEMARLLGYWPDLPPEGRLREYSTAGGNFRGATVPAGW